MTDLSGLLPRVPNVCNLPTQLGCPDSNRSLTVIFRFLQVSSHRLKYIHTVLSHSVTIVMYRWLLLVSKTQYGWSSNDVMAVPEKVGEHLFSALFHSTWITCVYILKQGQILEVDTCISITLERYINKPNCPLFTHQRQGELQRRSPAVDEYKITESQVTIKPRYMPVVALKSYAY